MKLRTVVTMLFYQSTHVKIFRLSVVCLFLFAVYFNFARSCTRGLPVQILRTTRWLEIDFGLDSYQISAILIGLVHT
jgi:hypothetical protein